jgi:transposase
MTELGDKYGVMSTGLISSWVKQYNQFGKSALLPKKRGRKVVMKRKRSKLNEEEKTEYIKKLEEELKAAQLENKLLKQLRGLSLAKEKQKKSQE